MNGRPYDKFTEDQCILRDFLAMDRTLLANERTFLAYVRTALALAGAGLTLVKFFDDRVLAVIGWCCVPLGLATLVIGIWRYQRMNRSIRKAGNGK